MYAVVVAAVDLDAGAGWQDTVKKAAAVCSKRLYVVLSGGAVARTSDATLEVLRELFDAACAATGKPTLDVVPLSAATGRWTGWLGAVGPVDACVGMPPEPGWEGCVELPAPCAEPGAPVAAGAPLGLHRALAVGGTFDRLHAGHRLLLAATCACATAGATVYVGIAGDELLRKKAHADLLEPFARRAANVVAYLKRCQPALRVEVSALLDPRAPPKAATKPEITGLVISLETVAGAERLVQMRADRLGASAPPLEVVAVGLVGAESQSADAAKMGSSELRAEAAAAVAAEPAQAGLGVGPYVWAACAAALVVVALRRRS